MLLILLHFDKWRPNKNKCTKTINTNKATTMKVTLCKRHWPEKRRKINGNGTASMETLP